MTKVKRTITISAQLDNVVSRLSSKLDQSASEFIEYTLRDEEQIKELLKILRKASDPPTHKLQKIKKVLPA